MPTNYMTMSRQALYDLVWSKPLAQVANDFGISDVALAKRCAEVNIPVPPRDYWTHIQAGETPQRTPLPKRRTESPLGADALVEVLNREPDSPSPKPLPAMGKPDLHPGGDAALDSLPTELNDAHAAIKRTAVQLKLCKVGDFTWGERGERAGPIVSIQVSDALQARALCIADELLKSVEAADGKYQAQSETRVTGRAQAGRPENPHPQIGQLRIDGEIFEFRIDERRRRVPHIDTADDARRRKRGEYVYSPPWDYEPTGDLRLHLMTPGGHAFSTRKDGARKRLEDQISDILSDLKDRAQTEKRWREERRLRELQGQEQQRLAWEQSRRRDEHDKLISELERQAGAWHRARMLRRYLRAARRAIRREWDCSRKAFQ